MTHPQIIKGIVWLILGGTILGAWTWCAVRPYLVLRDIRSGSQKPETNAERVDFENPNMLWQP